MLQQTAERNLGKLVSPVKPRVLFRRIGNEWRICCTPDCAWATAWHLKRANLFRLGIIVFATISLSLTSVSSLYAGDQTQSKAVELDKLRQQINRLKEKLDQDYNRQGKLRVELRSTERAIGHIARSLKKLGAELKTQTKDLHVLERRRKVQLMDMRSQRQALAEQLRASYAMGRQSYLKLVLSQQNPSYVGRSLAYYRYFSQARTKRIKSIKQTLLAVEEMREAVENKANRLQKLYADHQLQKKALEKTYQKRKNVLARLNSKIHSREQRLKRMLEDERQLNLLLQNLQNALADIPPNVTGNKSFSVLKGKLRWPVAGRLKARFGSARKLGNMKWHGVLIEAQPGDDVRAISHGRVAFADWLRGFGLLIIVDHGDGYMSLYGHNQTLYKEAGDWVEAGEVIAGVGMSGGRQSSALYFEIRHNGRPTNPAKWCRRRKG